MRTLSLAFVILAVLLAGFAWWGMNSAGGRGAFDEMAGILPIAAVPASFLPILPAILCWWLADRRKEGY